MNKLGYFMLTKVYSAMKKKNGFTTKYRKRTLLKITARNKKDHICLKVGPF